MKFHTTKDGRKIKLSDLEMSHLKNIIKWIERKAEEGLTIRMGGGFTGEDIWYDEKTYYGEDAKRQLNFSDYKDELDRRINIPMNPQEKGKMIFDKMLYHIEYNCQPSMIKVYKK